jgi:hypothetical protein
MLTPDPLTDEEKRWIRRCRKLFLEAPARFEFVTTGDANFDIIDGPLADAHDVELADGGAHQSGVILTFITLKGRMHGVR